jgi:dephospho-CoA kinase
VTDWPHSSAEIQLVRLMARDGSSREEAGARLNSQMAIAAKIDYADQVVDNSGPRAELDSQVEALVRKIGQSVSPARWLVCWLVPPLGAVVAVWTLLTRRRRK